MQYFIITGSSRGFGAAIVQMLLEHTDCHVTGISRTPNKDHTKHERFKHVKLDLGNIQQLQKHLGEVLPDAEYADKITLINNAALLGPSGYLGELQNEDLVNLFNCNVSAPAVLINAFLQKYIPYTCPKTIINISSGAASKPMDGWAGYCASKAAMDMLSEVAVDEQNKRGHNVRVFTVAPGVIDTDMQTEIRDTSEENFSNRKRFVKLKKAGELSTPEATAEKLLYLLENESMFRDTLVSLRDL